MAPHTRILILAVAAIAIAWTESLRRRSDRTQSYWVLLVIGTLILGVGELIRPGRPLAHGLQMLASGVLTMAGMTLLAALVIGGTSLKRPAIDDAHFLRKCRRSFVMLAAGMFGVFLLFILFAASFPSLFVPASYFVGRGMRSAMTVPMFLYVPLVIVWFFLFRRKPFTVGLLRRGRMLWLFGITAVVLSFLHLALHVGSFAATGFHPSAGVASAYVVISLAAVMESLIVLSTYWLAVWGLAAGA